MTVIWHEKQGCSSNPGDGTSQAGSGMGSESPANILLLVGGDHYHRVHRYLVPRFVNGAEMRCFYVIMLAEILEFRNDLRQAILASKARIVRDPSPEEVMAHLNLISHPADIPIVLAAMRAKVDYLVTLNRKHFIDDPAVAQQAGLRIGTPGEVPNWVRGKISAEDQ
jgi:hypothetical protein